MEALAARQSQKQQAALSSSGRNNAAVPSAKVQTPQERLELNRLLGLSDPPAQVFALGKDECAAVWWTMSNEDELITGWEVHRYRKDKSKPNEDAWHYKGYISYQTLIKNQTVIDKLSNDYEYRFTVKSINSKGVGLESSPSNAVMVEKPLPAGWYRFLDQASKRHYYANIRLNASSWTRPELDPWFLDEAIILNFQARELEALKLMYKEEMAHFGSVSLEQFMDVLREVGERCSKGWIRQLFRGYAGSEKSLTKWTHFMEVMNHIKKYRTGDVVVVQNPLEKIVLFFRRKKVGALLQPKAEKMGEWVIEYSSLAERNFYRNTKTGESFWTMPPQVKFYIPPKLEDKLLLVFDYGDLEEFQQYFSLLDVDNSGDLSGKEIKVLLRAMDIQISDSKFNRMLRTVDLNGNGTIEFDEYCWMMLQIFRKDNGGLWGEMRAKKKAVLAAAPPATDDNSGGSYLFEPSGASGGSLDDSLWGDKAWSNKLSYNRMRNVLNTMKQLRGAGGKTRQGRFSISGSVGSNLFTSLRRISLSSAGGRQNSINSISEESSSAPKSVSIFCCCFSRAKVKSEGTVSKLNAVLGKYDEVADIEIPVRVNSTPLYPAATFSQKPSAKSIKFGTTDGGDGSAIAPSEAEVLAANTRQNRRVSFSETGYGGESPGALSTQSRKSLGGSSVKVAPFVAADTSSVGTGAGVCSVDTGVETAGSRKARRGSNASMSSFGSSKQQIGVAPGVGGSTKGARSGSISGGAGGSSSSSRKRGKPTRDEDLSDSDDEGAGDDVDDRSVVSVTSLLKRVSSFGLLSGASVEQDPNAHPKYCMCGCRRY